MEAVQAQETTQHLGTPHSSHISLTTLMPDYPLIALLKSQLTSGARVFTADELSAEDYHAENQHISSSQLVHVLRSPGHFLHHISKGGPEESELMRLGTAAHCLVLEPASFKDRFVFAPRAYDLRRTADKSERNAIAENYPGRTILTPDQHQTLNNLAMHMRNHAKATELLSAKGLAELSIFWRDDATGLHLKARLDRLVQIGSTFTMVEVKSTTDASKEAFRRKINDMCYDMRAVMYAEACQKAFGFTPQIEWLVIEGETGFIATYRPTPRTLKRGRDRYQQALAALARAKASNFFPAYQTGHESEYLDPPAWVKD